MGLEHALGLLVEHLQCCGLERAITTVRCQYQSGLELCLRIGAWLAAGLALAGMQRGTCHQCGPCAGSTGMSNQCSPVATVMRSTALSGSWMSSAKPG